jgi:hypothetical protein
LLVTFRRRWVGVGFCRASPGLASMMSLVELVGYWARGNGHALRKRFFKSHYSFVILDDVDIVLNFKFRCCQNFEKGFCSDYLVDSLARNVVCFIVRTIANLLQTVDGSKESTEKKVLK